MSARPTARFAERVIVLRLFVGIALPEEIAARLSRACSGVPGARWVDPASFHVTLRFIGEVDGAVADDIHQALCRVAVPGFDLRIAGVGCFESGKKVRSLWAGVERSELLVRLRDKVEVAVNREVPAERRKFKPHITLARFKNGVSDRIGHYLERNNDLAIGPVPVDRFTLFRSHLGGEGAYYEHLADYFLPSSESAAGRRLSPH